MNQFIPTYRGQPKHTEPSTNSYATAYGYGFDSRELNATLKDLPYRTFVSCVSGGQRR